MTFAKRRIPLGRAYGLVQLLLEAAAAACPEAARLGPAGSLRRFAATVGDLMVVGSAESDEQADAILECLGALPMVADLRRRGRRGASLLTGREEIRVELVRPAAWGAVLLHRTGSASHVEQLERLASSQRLLLSPAGLGRAGGATLPAASEEEVYAALGLPFIPPELREGTDEIEAAAAGRLPRLVSGPDIRGDLHVHTEWSDGHDALETVVAAADALGYEYVAITDHSQTAAAGRVLSADDLVRQGEAIARLREDFPRLTVLRGVEVDILPDGGLDFPDALLEPLDIVLASLHEGAGHSPARLLGRYQAAMRHPLVNVITHPTNRLLGRRDPYELDWDALFEGAVATGTALEVDGAPAHLDMDGALARRAVTAGALVAINSDAHHASLLGRQMTLGVATARRGWVEAARVVNARPLQNLLAFVARKRSGGGPSGAEG